MVQILVDAVLFGGLVAGGALGYRSGVMKKIFNIGIVIGTIVVLALCLRPVGAFFVDTVLLADPKGYMVALVLLIGITVIPSMVVYHWLDRKSASGESSRFFGGVLGLFEGAFVLSAMLSCLNLISLPPTEIREECALYKPIAGIAPKTFRFFVPLVPRGDALQAELSRIFHESFFSRRTSDLKEKL